ncbi:hypothetical protein ACLOJK_007759 [Asimina triloba]
MLDKSMFLKDGDCWAAVTILGLGRKDLGVCQVGCFMYGSAENCSVLIQSRFRVPGENGDEFSKYVKAENFR